MYAFKKTSHQLDVLLSEEPGDRDVFKLHYLYQRETLARRNNKIFTQQKLQHFSLNKH
jgi:hypothetical protein